MDNLILGVLRGIPHCKVILNRPKAVIIYIGGYSQMQVQDSFDTQSTRCAHIPKPMGPPPYAM